MKSNNSIRIAAYVLVLASLTFSGSAFAQPQDQGMETAQQLIQPGVAGTLTIDGTGLRALSAQETDTIDGTGLQDAPADETDTIDGTGWRELSDSDATLTIDGTGLLGQTTNADLAASGQPLNTIDADSGGDCEAPAGASAAASANCEPVNPDTD